MSKKTWHAIWLGWAVYFAISERKSLKSGQEFAPLSWHLRWVLGIKSHKAHRIVGEVAFWGFVGWLWRHLYHPGAEEV